MDFINGPSGGLSYHAAALRYRKTRWSPFVRTVAHWLKEEWNPRDVERLVIFGTSAGWTLPPDFLARFKSVVAVEPDPVARWIFRRRFGSCARTLEFVPRADLLPWFTRESDRFKKFLDDQPVGTSILFSNLLGQLPLLRPTTRSSDDTARGNVAFLRALSGRSWASYHDLISSPHRTLALTPAEIKPEETLEQIAANFYRSPRDVIDHETLWLAEGRPTASAIWEIRPSRRHVIAFVHSNIAVPKTPSVSDFRIEPARYNEPVTKTRSV